MKMAEGLAARALPGAMDWGEGLVTFALFAPGKKSVHVIGGFNGWNNTSDPLENRGDGLWVRTMTLRPGPCYYQYLINDSLVICDPYAQAIERGSPDDPPQAIIDIGRPIYQWQYEYWQRPQIKDLIIYELHVGDFSPEGTFQGVIDKLDYLQSLGINAIEFMPLYEGEDDDYWGYRPTYFLAVRKSYGPMQDLLTLVDQAHRRGIAVLLDIVLAHTGQRCPLNQMYPYHESPWYGRSLGELNQFGLPMLDFTKGATNSFVRDVQSYWLGVFHFDGFRYDYLAGIGADYSNGKGLPYLMSTARQIRPEAYLLGEYIPEDPSLVNDSGLSAVFHARSKLMLESLIVEEPSGEFSFTNFAETVKVLDPSTQGYKSPTFMLNYVENHDEHRIIRHAHNRGFHDEVAYRKAALAITALLTSPGEPLLYHGQEWGCDLEKSMEINKLVWSKLDEPQGQALYKHTMRMCLLRRSRPCLSGGSFNFILIEGDRKCVAYHRQLGDLDQVIVILNFSPEQQEVNIAFPRSGQWHQVETGRIIDVTKPIRLKLDAYSYDIYSVGVS